jgi:hypothetical protein
VPWREIVPNRGIPRLSPSLRPRQHGSSIARARKQAFLGMAQAREQAGPTWGVHRVFRSMQPWRRPASRSNAAIASVALGSVTSELEWIARDE